MPTTTRILYDGGSRLGKQVATAVDRLLDSQAEMRRVKKIIDSATFNSDWASLAAELGGGITSQNAADLWTIFSNAAGRVDDAAVTECARLDQG